MLCGVLGKYLAIASLKAGLKVIATARNLATISSLKDAGATVMQLDVTSTEEEIAAIAKKAIAIQWAGFAYPSCHRTDYHLS